MTSGRMSLPVLGGPPNTGADAWNAVTFDPLHVIHRESRRMRMEFWTEALISSHSRETALSVLAKEFLQDNGIHRELAPILGGSTNIMAIIFQEIFAAHSRLRFPVLLDKICKRVSDAFILLKCVASHPNTRMLLFDAKIIFCMRAFLDLTDCRRPYELLRFSCLSVISALVQDDDEEIVEGLLKTRLFPHILASLERGPEFTKTVAAFIVFRIMMHDSGLKYCCVLSDRFSAISRTLAVVVSEFGPEPHPLLLSCVTGCYFRLSQHPRACDGLTIWLPERLQNLPWTTGYHDEPEIVEWARQLRNNVANRRYNHMMML